jgi:hypothetical protein
MTKVRVTETTKDTVYYQFQGQRSVSLGSFSVEERTQFPKNFKEGKEYMVIYCPTHNVAYQFQEWP